MTGSVCVTVQQQSNLRIQPRPPHRTSTVSSSPSPTARRTERDTSPLSPPLLHSAASAARNALTLRSGLPCALRMASPARSPASYPAPRLYSWRTLTASVSFSSSPPACVSPIQPACITPRSPCS